MEYFKSNVPCGRALVVKVCILHARASIVEIRLEACDGLHFGGTNCSKMTDQLQTDLKQNTFDSNAGVMGIFPKLHIYNRGAFEISRLQYWEKAI